MSRTMLAKVVEAFFRHPILYVLPFIALVGFGFYSLSATGAEYTSQASVFVDSDSFVTDRTGIDGGVVRGFKSPANFASQELNGLLRTDVFMESVLEDAGVELSTDPIFRSYQVDSAKTSVASFSSGENLMTISVTTGNPLASERLAAATIDRFLEFKISLDVAESEASERFFADLADDYLVDLDAASRALDDFLAQIPATSLDQLSAVQQRELDRLTESERSAEVKHRSTLEDLEASRLAALQAETDVRQSISVVDPPQVANQPNSSSFDRLLTLAMFTVLGVALVVVGPTVAALLDRGFQFTEDLARVTDVSVIAVVPRVAKRDLRLDHVSMSEHQLAEPIADDVVARRGPPTLVAGEGRGTEKTGASARHRDLEAPVHGHHSRELEAARTGRDRTRAPTATERVGRWSRRVGEPGEGVTDASVTEGSTDPRVHDDESSTWRRSADA